MSDGVYRAAEDRLGASEREEEAVRVLGKWRDRLKAIVISIFGIGGIPLAGGGYYLAQELQFKYNHGIAFLKLNVGGACVAWAIMFVIGAFVGRRLVRARTPSKIAELATAYEVPAESLQQIATMVDRL